MLLELLVVHLGIVYASHGQYSVEPRELHGLFLLLRGVLLVRSHIGHVHQLVEGVCLVVPFRLLVEVLDDVLRHQPDAPRVFQSPVCIYAPHLRVLYLLLLLHGADVLHPERQHVLVPYGIYYGVAVQFLPEGLCGGLQLGVSARACVHGKDRCSGEPEDIVFLEPTYDVGVHLSELGTVAFVEDEHYLFLKDGVHLRVVLFLQERGEFLYGSDDDLGIGVEELMPEHSGGCVAVGCVLLKLVVLLHGLVVQVLTVHHEHHLVHELVLGGHLSRLERGERLSASGGVPDVPTGFQGALPVVVVCHQNPV